jgi:predicted  nucleic acid-binding Zn-ribbon protein
MDDRTPDGRPIADWVYELYSGSAEEPEKEISSLSAWMQNIYKQENQGDRLFRKMVNRIETLDKTIETLDKTVETLDKRVETLDNTVEARDETIASLQNTLADTIADRERRLGALGHELELERIAHQGILNSRSWKFMQSLQQVRKFFIPEGSRREAYFLKLFKS